MELKEFIKQTIIQITDGLLEGHKYIQDNKFGEGVNGDRYKEINFDVAVSSNEEEKTGINGKISIANIFTAGGKDESSMRESNMSRIQFKIYIHINTKE